MSEFLRELPAGCTIVQNGTKISVYRPGDAVPCKEFEKVGSELVPITPAPAGGIHLPPAGPQPPDLSDAP